MGARPLGGESDRHTKKSGLSHPLEATIVRESPMVTDTKRFILLLSLSPPSNGSGGSITIVSLNRSAVFHQPGTRPLTTVATGKQSRRRHSHDLLSERAGAVHSVLPPQPVSVKHSPDYSGL